MCTPDNAPPRLCLSVPPKPRVLRRCRWPPLWASLPPENRRRLSQIMARVIAQPSLPRQQEVPDDCASSATARREGSRIEAPR